MLTGWLVWLFDWLIDLNVLFSGGPTFLPRNAAPVCDSHGGHLHIAHHVWQSSVAGVAMYGGDGRWGRVRWNAPSLGANMLERWQEMAGRDQVTFIFLYFKIYESLGKNINLCNIPKWLVIDVSIWGILSLKPWTSRFKIWLVSCHDWGKNIGEAAKTSVFGAG